MVVSVVSTKGVDSGKTKNSIPVPVIGRFFKATPTFGTANFDIPGIAVALLIVGVVIGLSGLILSIFASATANSITNPQPGTMAYNLTHPIVSGMISFYGFFPTLYVLLGVAGIVLIAAGIISIIMEKFKSG
jgi:hypothetical protein